MVTVSVRVPGGPVTVEKLTAVMGITDELLEAMQLNVSIEPKSWSAMVKLADVATAAGVDEEIRNRRLIVGASLTSLTEIVNGFSKNRPS